MKKIHIIPFFGLFLFIHCMEAQVPGCTDPMAVNYNPSANRNDGSCTYNEATVTPAASYNLGPNLSETSGLIVWNNQVWTHNDNTDIRLYGLDTINGSLLKTYTLTGTLNKDWEEISQDAGYIYVGDFGNNQNGNRTDLKILRISKTSLLMDAPVRDTIHFSYSDQVSFDPAGANNTDFDCEAFIVSADSIFLFTKQWISNKTGIYSLPKKPGTYVARLKNSLDVKGLVTGATYLESKRLIVLCGYSGLLEPFLYLLYDFNGYDFVSGNKRKIQISLPFHQVEGIATVNGLKYYISNESFAQLPYINNPQKMHILDLKPYLENYLRNQAVKVTENLIMEKISVYPVPASNSITIRNTDFITSQKYFIINYLGQTVSSGELSGRNPVIEISGLDNGIFILKIGLKNSLIFKIIKR